MFPFKKKKQGIREWKKRKVKSYHAIYCRGRSRQKKKRNEPKRFAFTEEPQHYGLHAKVSEMLCKRICHWLCKSTTQLNKGLRF